MTPQPPPLPAHRLPDDPQVAMRSLPEERARLLRTVLPLQLIPAGVFLGAVVGLILGDGIRSAPLIVMGIAWVAWMIGMLLTPSRILRSEVRLQQRLTAAAETAADPRALTGWHPAPAILTRVMRAGKQARFRTVVYLAAAEGQTRPVAVRLALHPVPQQHSTARLLLSPHDPAVAIIDPSATAADHAATAGDPRLAEHRSRDGGQTRQLLPWLGVGLAAMALTAAVLLVLS